MTRSHGKFTVILFLFTKENMSKIAIVEDDHTILEMYKLKFEFAKFKKVRSDLI